MRSLPGRPSLRSVKVSSSKEVSGVYGKRWNAHPGGLRYGQMDAGRLPYQFLPLRLNFHGSHPRLYSQNNAVLVAFYLDSDLPFLSYLAVYSYDVYFSIIVLKVGLKLI